MKQSAISFDAQVLLGLLILIVCISLSELLHTGIFQNIAWILFGLLSIIHPVWPVSRKQTDVRQLRLYARIAGLICVLVGLVGRFPAAVQM